MTPITHEWLTWVSTHLLPSFPHSWTSPLPGIQPGTRICAPETFPGDNQPKSTRAGFGWDKAHFAHSTVRGWGLALYLKWWKKSSLSQPKAAHHRLVKWHKYGSRKNTYLGMRGSTTVQTGYSHLLLQNTNSHLISEASLYPCGSEVCTAGKFFISSHYKRHFESLGNSEQY